METTPLITRTRQSSFWPRLKIFNFSKKELSSRTICIGQLPDEEYPKNHVCNQKYNIITFLPLVLFEQFRFFLNLYFLVMALSQFVPSIRIGYLYTYWGPLCFVLSVTLFREAIDDFRRYRRDREVNRQRYERAVLSKAPATQPPATERVPASALRVGDIVTLHRGQRVPADMLLLRTHEATGTMYIRTDQLDGETDWKLRVPLASTQKLAHNAQLLSLRLQVFAERPQRDIHTFIGACGDDADPLDVANTLWSGCVLASGQATGLVIYTGSETRSVMNNAAPRSKVGRLDLQVNDLTKVLFVAVLLISFLMIVLKGFAGPWYQFLFRFVLLFSYIIPISLRVNLDMGKAFYSWMVQRDRHVAGTVMRSTTIPEELGRVRYLLADKTGTLTRNEMVFQKLHLGAGGLFDKDNFHEIEALLTQHITNDAHNSPSEPSTPDVLSTPNVLAPNVPTTPNLLGTPNVSVPSDVPAPNVSVPSDVPALNVSVPSDVRAPNVSVSSDVPAPNVSVPYNVADRGGPSAPGVYHAVLALALCHNVTPVYEDEGDGGQSVSDLTSSVVSESCGGAVPQQQLCDYQASSPDEVALVKWTDMMGISLYRRDTYNISVKLRASNEYLQYSILQMFPFTSETKMMGIIVQEENTSHITYYVKGADVALSPLVQCDWLLAQSSALAAEGLRTLVVAKRDMTQQEYLEFEAEYRAARQLKAGRGGAAAAALAQLRRGLRVLGLTGVEDRLADHVPRTLAVLRAAGLKIWMLTGDKLETALCIARSLRMGAAWREVRGVATRPHAHAALHAAPGDLVIEGDSLEVCLHHYEAETLSLLCACGGVVVARCSPTQKARVARLLRARGVVAAVGDGGNDVAMIQEADVGIGIAGAEGRAASLAGDVSVPAFAHLARLLLVHGRRSFLRSCALSLFIVHRGLIVSTMQAVFSVVFYFSSVSLYPGFLMVGYGTVYTMLPVFSLVLDKDMPSSTLFRHPELYRQLATGRQLSYKTFCIWTGISIYQGGVIMYGALVLFEEQLIHIVEISYTALIVTELVMAALTVRTWHALTAAAELASLLMYTATLLLATSYFDGDFIRHWGFWWKVTVITLVSCLPLYLVKYAHKKYTDKKYRRLRNASRSPEDWCGAT